MHFFIGQRSPQLFLSVFSLLTSGPWPIKYYLPSTYGPLADFVAIHGFLYILTKLAYLQGLPTGMSRRELVNHTSVRIFSGHGISFNMKIGPRAFYPLLQNLPDFAQNGCSF